MSAPQEEAASRGRSAIEQQVAGLRAQIGDDLKALRGSWERGWSWPRDVSGSTAVQAGGFMRAVPAWAAGVLAGLLASVLMARRAQPPTDESRPTTANERRQ